MFARLSFIKTVAFSLSFFFFTLAGQGQSFVETHEAAQINHVFEQVNFNGGGVAFVDIDNDDDDDMYLVGGNAKDRLLINDGNGIFTDISASAGLEMTDSMYTTGVIYGDIDNDGFQDIFVNTYFSENLSFSRNLLYRNNGDNTFTEIWTEGSLKDLSMTMSSVFIDYDNDGYLDIYNVNYVDTIRFTYDANNAINGFDHVCFPNYMYKNNGDGTFSDVTAALGLADTGCGLAVTATDADHDGDLDLLVGNDFGPFIQSNKLYKYDKPTGVFHEVSVATNTNSEMFSMGIAIGDYDNDLDLDYYVSNLGANVFLQQNGSQFEDVADAANVANEFTGNNNELSVSWGTFFADMDNDMDLDLFVANGYVPAPAFVDNGKLDLDVLYLNNGDRTFTALDSIDGIANDLVSRGCAYSDVDNDGRLDIFSVVYDKPAFGLEPISCLYKNQMGGTNNWIKIKLEGTVVNKNAYGSKVWVYTDGQAQLRETSGGSSFCSHNSSIIHFGVAEHTMIDSIRVDWTGYENTVTLYDIPTNQLIKIVEDASTVNIEELEESKITFFPNPTSGEVYIQNNSSSQIEEIRLRDLTGKLIGKVSENNEIINLSMVNAGIYFLEFQLATEVVVEKIIKE